ncbi:M23 family metallopeptidase [Streptomyces caatingaensis]|uniref:M23ase beta-sheet core domain-containing protein n=1 Tax=Streptomyces caatingaensis TaxID=1678637 RepID=A0A0K9X759_9ACTN|nr:M23 family metallopeptidase [Streptomyces caatingaensis]KNB49279.1 hypothetical protein AC230_28760 [Streptomyces caatingaensis]
MASNSPTGEDSSHVSWPGPDPSGEPAPDGRGPVADGEGPVRGRHRVPRQRGGTMARGGAVLGAGVIAAVGAGAGVATAQERPAPISVPDVDPAAGGGVYASASGDEDATAATAATGTRPHAEAQAQADAQAHAAPQGPADAGEALRARILQQADPAAHHDAAGSPAQERAAADAQRMAAAKARAAATQADQAVAHARQTAAGAGHQAGSAVRGAAHHSAEAAARAAAQATGPQTTATRQAAAKASKARAEARRAAEGMARAKHRYVLPVSSYRITARFGSHGGMWSHRHTGTDFAAPTGSPVKAVSGGRITHAGWAGSYGYRIVLRLDDGTELWFCHLSSMVVTHGEVAPGQVIGRVGATGNVTGPHLHLEVRPHGGHPVDPLHWLRSKGLHP